MNPTGHALVGTMLDGRYLIEAPIARGGMSTVFRATDTRLGRQVAAKVMHTEFAADPAFLSRFEFEARSVAGLKESSLVAVYDQGVDGDHPFMIMELIRGGTLRELLRERGPMPPHAAYAVLRPVLAALGAAHRAGLVHRDVKPENVLIADDGDVKLADFGLVRAVAGATTTASSVMLGTAAYLSPEQVDTGRATSRSDVYAVGILLYEVLTGRTPFPGDTNVSIAYRRLTDDVPPPGDAIAGIPREFDELVLRATGREPADRFPDAGAFATALDDVAARLALPRFRVPAPRNSAQHRSMAVPPPDHSPRPSERQGEAAGVHPPHTSTHEQPPGPHPTRVYTAPHPRDDEDHPADGGGTANGDTFRAHDAEYPAAASEVHIPSAGHYTPRAAKQRRRSRRMLVAWGIVAVVLAALIGVGGWWFTSGRLTTVPALDGMDKAAVLAAITQADLTPRVDETYSDTAAEGSVISVTPPPGTRIARSSTITVAVSMGRPTIPAPGTDSTVEAVSAQLRQRTLVPKRGADEYSTDVAEGNVLRLAPEPGTTVPVGSAVTVTASKGPPPVHIPDVKGMSPQDAKDALAAAHLTVDSTRTDFDPDVDKGRVSGTDPSAATVVSYGSEVALIVSNALTVPDLAGMSPSRGRTALAAAGLEYSEGAKTSDTDEDAGTIAKTSPPAGERVDPDHPEVRVHVSNAVTVPSLVGGRVSTARSSAQKEGLALSVRQLIDSDNSLVISQDPSSGSHVAPGSTVTVTAVP